MARAGPFRMDFAFRPKSPGHILSAVGFITVGVAVMSTPVLAVAYGNYTAGGLAVLILLGIPLGLGALFIGWLLSIEIKVDLSYSPREARCWRRNIFTRIATRHRYPIAEGAKVLIHDKTEDTDDPRDHGSWSVTIQGLPRYYDFWYLGHCKTYGEAVKLARQLASFLDIPVTTWDDRKNPNLKRPSQLKAERKRHRGGDGSAGVPGKAERK
jgi:hypothetical protein